MDEPSPKKTFGFGKRLKEARIALGMTQEELGKGAGEKASKDARKASVSDWEKEKHYPKADQIRVICLKLKVSADELIFGDIKEDEKVLAAAHAFQALTDEQRRKLLATMMGDAVPDHEVEHKMTVARTAKAPKAK